MEKEFGIDPVKVMNKVKSNLYGWYNDTTLNAEVNECVKKGFFLRTSHTQVEWTQSGVDKVKPFL